MNRQEIEQHFETVSKLSGISVERLKELRSQNLTPTLEETGQLAKGLMQLDLEQVYDLAGIREVKESEPTSRDSIRTNLK